MPKVNLPHPARSYNILLPMPGSDANHWNLLIPLTKALADRGHKIVTLQAIPAVFNHPNITEVVLPLGRSNSPSNHFDIRRSLTGGIHLLEETLPAKASKFYTIPVVKDFYRRRKEFDVIITTHIFNEMAYPFALGVPLILVITTPQDSRLSAVMGNVHHPAYVPNLHHDYPHPLGFLDRLQNLFFHIYLPGYWGLWGYVPKIQKEVSAHLPDIPPLLDIERNVSLVLLNYQFVAGYAMPLLPSEVEVGGMHCVPGQPLPQDLESWIKGAGPVGVVYFSLGTVATGTKMPLKYRDLFVKAFARLQYRFIWKFESALEDVSENVLLRSHLPQQDILADPRVKLFISHGGRLSTQEAVYHATPVLVIPIFADQHRNALEIVRQGVGLSLHWDELTVDLLVNSIKEIINNGRYMSNIKKVSAVIRDRPESPLDRAVFWTEHVIRHQGALHLKSPAAQLSWVEFFMLDILAFLFLVALAVSLTLRKFLQTACTIRKRERSKTKEA
ncbi:UDP-glycosyltransferase UGT5-like [Panulirus ornatus]|uniref:UDP-glycosyltransferase UGT5-like n=1 Tax=Panulirus ornatus TaxID=150431 RepID=UPI003A852D17